MIGKADLRQPQGKRPFHELRGLAFTVGETRVHVVVAGE
jgi:hypothetical protein